MRIYFYWGPSHRDDGAGSALLTAMERLGQDVWRFQCVGDPANFGKADLHIEVDWGADCFLEKDWIPPKPNFFWCSDTHWGKKAYKWRLDHARKFDMVAVNIRSDVARFRKDGVKAFWLPYAADPYIWHGEHTKEHSIVFVGHWANYKERMNFLDSMFREFPDFGVYEAVYGKLGADRICRGAISINHCQTKEINMRVMETLATGTFLLTPESPTLGRLGLKDGVHLATYRNIDEAKEKAHYYLANEVEREEIAWRGRQLLLDRHTYVHRALDILHRWGEHPAEFYKVNRFFSWWATPNKERIMDAILPKEMR